MITKKMLVCLNHDVLINVFVLVQLFAVVELNCRKFQKIYRHQLQNCKFIVNVMLFYWMTQIKLFTCSDFNLLYNLFSSEYAYMVLFIFCSWFCFLIFRYLDVNEISSINKEQINHLKELTRLYVILCTYLQFFVG